MPIYEYQCNSCNHHLEKLQKISDARLTQCPACNRDELRRKISAAGFRLKGGGWYETDFKAGSKKNLAGDSAAASSSAPSESAASPAPASAPAPASPPSTSA